MTGPLLSGFGSMGVGYIERVCAGCPVRRVFRGGAGLSACCVTIRIWACVPGIE